MANRRDHVRTIRTPEGITFSYTLAGPATRAIAWLIDQAIISTAYYIAMQLSMPFIFSGVLAGAVVAVMSVAYFIFTFAYYIVQEWLWRGQTVGKRLMRLRVMDELKKRGTEDILIAVVDGLK